MPCTPTLVHYRRNTPFFIWSHTHAHTHTHARHTQPPTHTYTIASAPLVVIGRYHACAVSVGLVGDICRCVGPAIKAYTNLYMHGLGQAIQDPELDRSVKPQILSCIGDVAMALGPDFLPYVTLITNTDPARSCMCIGRTRIITSFPTLSFLHDQR